MHDDSAVAKLRAHRLVDRGILRSSTWRELAFHALHFPVAVAGFAWLLVATTIGVLFAASGVGLPGAAALFASIGWVAAPTRALSAQYLGRPVATPPQTEVRSAMSVFRDPASWRAFAYSGVGFALTGTTFLVSSMLLAIALAAFTFPLWRSNFIGFDGIAFTSNSAGPTLFVVGALLLVLVWPVVNHGLARVQSFVIDALLGPTPSELRLAELAASRDATLEGAHTVLRSIERDLHDGTQARVVNLAMILGDALDRVRSGADPAIIESQLASAVEVTTETLAELRALVRGIHPPVLGSGLEAALQSAVGRAGLPVRLHVDVPTRPSPIVESIAYFAVLELLTNVQKHSNARSASVDISRGPDGLVAEVNDDGQGGARVDDPAAGRGTGLAGVRERVRAVNGHFTIDSPSGGPTTARFTIPETSGR
ncbi:sensor histidine kinase [Rhodococcus sovatensis]|uniref:histidine kinase n=1 Tax=Rhodococcus sovatensis TaxID=1805840 RepID=A0ABZ2PIQ9_9NOCA